MDLIEVSVNLDRVVQIFGAYLKYCVVLISSQLVTAIRNAFTVLMQYVHSVDSTLSSSETLQKEALGKKPQLKATAVEDGSIYFKFKNVGLLATFASHQNCLLTIDFVDPVPGDEGLVFLMYTELKIVLALKNQINKGRHYHFHQI